MRITVELGAEQVKESISRIEDSIYDFTITNAKAGVKTASNGLQDFDLKDEDVLDYHLGQMFIESVPKYCIKIKGHYKTPEDIFDVFYKANSIETHTVTEESKKTLDALVIP